MVRRSCTSNRRRPKKILRGENDEVDWGEIYWRVRSFYPHDSSFSTDNFGNQPTYIIFEALKHGLKLHQEEKHLNELGIATLTSMFVNANSDPKKSAPCKPSDFFFFQVASDKGLTPDSAETFFSLAAEQRIPAWVLPHMPLKELAQARKGKTGRRLFPRAWMSEGEEIFILGPKVKGNMIKFEFALVAGLAQGEIRLVDVDTGYEVIAEVPEQPHDNTLIVDGEFTLIGD